ncbi:MAG: acetyl/propionyl/methylcrotonyl-CoA carboxylase subunit alpha [Rhodospirillaceae bacterium]|nr:acetyl/propionyl/methylcrotonyl-CoA carboxylase subunit alpha [Rhodospirillaceae bacterium]MBT4689531.1 acetyl/propionyl/methylcrotonyl-CoA carboxylase subunit alpha [Rhodospirillaceae bacterium]MBT5522741.1 acetyl/propionyl/methylcrotonyl-CoA carboxylase subunit alpha [Rhodospirillaceae bacterium]MBT5878153.1 acetyl/propionyl/methylcrotonyl-CoA carboxylase subunit alpha [Rhodospirillaceae bacterium]MBT6588240.1 acetyl/propionyl/methylcrotonyl-CoA carboxylase subunit alpha [Rhodospirillaceae
MFSKILIANRGEIACRVIRSAQAMGIATVAVYSEADAGALHVEMADEAIAIGPAAAAESYLVTERILDAIKRSGADAVHPGYGFLSENPGFAEALAERGIAFIGPPVGAIEAMGDKIASKKLAQAAGVNSVPGHLEVLLDEDDAARISEQLGYPVMLKASAGGGGKGMRVAYTEAEAREGFTSATNEAMSSFADDRVFAEKFIEQPRHIEIQVLADAHGNCIYLGERECSIQRRHQKVIEEAPSPFLDEATRKAMGEQAVALARAVDYRSAGTVEFIVDKDRNFYFLEMNTRLQVEHPVTEMVYGVDLVEQMIRIAAGETMGLTQDDMQADGWAIECRLYAEDPYRNFMPSIGRLTQHRPPPLNATVRVDTGVVEGSEITMFYDPMIAKLITKGADRAGAIAAMGEALDGYCVRGINHNMSFLSALISHPRFVEGRLTTAFIDEEYPDGFSGAPRAGEVLDAILAAGVLLHRRTVERAATISGQLAHYQPAFGADWSVSLDGEGHQVIATLVEGGMDVTSEGRTIAVRSDWRPGAGLFKGSVNGRHVVIQVDMAADGFRLSHAGVEAMVCVRSPRAAELAGFMLEKIAPDTSKYLLCPMPGLVISLAVEPGEEVKGGQALAVVEAMKMENILRAERDGIVAILNAAPGDSLAVDDIIMEFE